MEKYMGLVNIDEQQYRALPLINQSAIKHGMRSMAHMKAYLDGEIKYTSDALSLGSLVHAVVLEEEYFADMYAIAGPRLANKPTKTSWRSTQTVKSARKKTGKSL